MTAAPTAAPKKSRQGMSTTAKVFGLLLALLFVVVAGFVFSAWRELNRITPPAINPNPSGNQVEMLTPQGAGQNVPVFVPGSNNNVATQGASAVHTTPPSPTAATRPNPAKPAATANIEVPVLPINTEATAAAKPAAPPPAPSNTPAANKPKNTLDHLF